MPIYEYKCANGHTFEAMQRMADDPLTECEECGAPVERVFHPVAVHFKGSGFYTTDYGSKSKASGSEGEAKSSDGGSGSSDSESKSSTGESKSSGGSGGSGEKKAKSSSSGD